MSSVFRRIKNIFRVEQAAALEQVQEPVSVRETLAQLDARLASAVTSTEQAVAEAANSYRSAQSERAEASLKSVEWTDKLLVAKARLADAPDNPQNQWLVDEAARRVVESQHRVKELDPVIADREQRLNALKQNLKELRQKHRRFEDRRAELIARDDLASAKQEVSLVLNEISDGNPLSEISQVDNAVCEREALAQGLAELADINDPDAALMRGFDEIFRDAEARQLAGGTNAKELP